MVIATWAASTWPATGITATAAIVLTLVRRDLVVLVGLPLATVGATETATATASLRRAIGITATATIFLQVVIRRSAQLGLSANVNLGAIMRAATLTLTNVQLTPIY